MSYIYKDKNGKYRYVYEVTAYRVGRKTRNKKVPIGRVDQSSGLVVYKEEYLERLRAAGEPMPDDMLGTQAPAPEDTAWETIAAEGIDAARSYGAQYLLQEIGKRVGLLPILQDIFPDTHEQLFGLASFLAASQESSLCNYKLWASQQAVVPNAVLSSQRISELLQGLDEYRCQDFYSRWMRRLPASEYTALDVTSISSYSKLIEDVAWGYNRDHEDLAQLNLCMLLGEDSKLPLYQTAYNGSITDMKQLLNTLDELTAVVPGRLLRLVMDKGFYNEANVRELLNRPNFKFLIAASFLNTYAKEQVDAVRGSIEDVANTVLEGSHALFGIHKVRRFPESTEHVHVFVFYNPYTANKARMELYGTVEELRRAVIERPRTASTNAARKYLLVRKSGRTENGITVSIRRDVIEDELKYCGWLVLIGNQVLSAQCALDIYRRKDVVEKGFDRLKNVFDLHRLRVHSDHAARAKLFVGFLAQILTCSIYDRMDKAGLMKTYTLEQLLQVLGGWRIGIVRGVEILGVQTKAQREILEKMLPQTRSSKKPAGI